MRLRNIHFFNSSTHQFTGGIRKSAYPMISKHEIFFRSPNQDVIRKLDNFLLKHSIVAYKDRDFLSISLKGFHDSCIESTASFNGSIAKSSDFEKLVLRISTSGLTRKLLMKFFVDHGITATVAETPEILLIDFN